LGFDPVVRAYVKWAMHRHDGLDRELLRTIWPIAVGRTWGERTDPVAVRGQTLEVAVSDSVWQSEVRFQTEHIVTRLNALLGDAAPPLTGLRVVLGSVPNWQPSKRVEAVHVPPPRELSDAEKAAVEEIEDEELRALVEKVARRDWKTETS